MPLFLYYMVNNGIVMAGGYLLRELVPIQQTDNGRLLQYLQTVVKMAGMFLAGAAVVPFYLREKAWQTPRRIVWEEENFKKHFSSYLRENDTENKPLLHRKEIAGMIVLGAVLGLGMNYLFAFLGVTQSSETYKQVAQTQFGLPLWLGILFYGILSPVVEELVFRGIVYSYLKRQTGIGVAVLVSALLFGGFHGNIVQMIYGSVMGVVFATCYEKYRNLGAPVLVHSAANIAVYTVLTFTG